MYTVRLLLEAEIELTDACAWYDKRKPGLGSDLIDEFDTHVQIILNNPFQFAINFSERYRFAVLKRFPYSIVYRIDDEADVVIITSMFHQHRNPERF